MHATALRLVRRVSPALFLGGALVFGCSDDGDDGPTDDGSAGSGNASSSSGAGASGSGAAGGQGSGGSGATGGAASNCPAAQPRGRESCSDDGLVCEYGDECCCGQCFPSYGCVCSGGVWGCSYTDACFAPSCGGTGGESSGRGGGA
ncbi:MAG: hypothetical protein WKG00_32270 [Polyangiaceae bacterium]